MLDALGTAPSLGATAARVNELLVADTSRLTGGTGSLRLPELQFAAVDAVATGIGGHRPESRA